MSIDNHDAQKPAKIKALESIVSKLRDEAGKEIISAQQINQAIGQAVLLWLPTLKEEKDLTRFFASIEIAGGAALARKIERHPLRPAAVAPIVAASRLKAEVEKLARKADAERAKKEREMQKLVELKAKYEIEAAATSTKPPKTDA